MIDLNAPIENHALYLPAVQPWFAELVLKDPTRELPVTPRDLNFQNAKSSLWTYRYCLANAMTLDRRRPNSITQRDPASSWVLGDSGGYQVGSGKGPIREFR